MPQPIGPLGERIAESFVTRRGCVVLGRNVHADGGEIDLVVRDGDRRVAVEVKTTSDGSDPLDAVDDVKVGLIIRTAASLRQTIDRIDVVAVAMTPSTLEVRWLLGID
ncbi:MAG: YraN family protein [Acidimicrobiia bacterium]